jgi:hypothetical protein
MPVIIFVVEGFIPVKITSIKGYTKILNPKSKIAKVKLSFDTPTKYKSK